MDDQWLPDPDLADEVDRAMARWRQGDVAEPGPNVWLALRDQPLTPQTAALEGGGLGTTQAKTDYVAVVTQTCDIVKPCSSRRGNGDSWPFVQVSPVVELAGTPMHEAAGGHSVRFAPLPALGEGHFADLNVCITMEKAVLSALDGPRPGCSNDAQRLAFAAAVARNRQRFAFPDGTDEVLAPLRKRFRDKRSKDSAERRRIDEVWEIRVRRADGTPWDAERVEMELCFVIAPESLPVFGETEAEALLSRGVKEWAARHDKEHELTERIDATGDPAERSFLWQQLVAAWVRRCATNPRVVVTGASAESAAGYSIARARAEPKLDLDHLSSP
jgi:hypothetical protein